MRKKKHDVWGPPAIPVPRPVDPYAHMYLVATGSSPDWTRCQRRDAILRKDSDFNLYTFLKKVGHSQPLFI